MSIIKRKDVQIIFLVILGCLIMAIVELFLKPGYIYKSLIKITTFSFCVFIYSFSNKDYSIFRIFKISHKKELFIAIISSITVYIIILVAYYISRNFIDFSIISQNLLEKENIKPENFIYISIYISIINSLIEEVFFRGFAFIKLKYLTKDIVAYLFSATAFSLYHIFIITGWFSFWLFILILISLIFSGLIFNYFDRKGNIYNSWIIHMLANLSINTIGFIMFGLI